MIQAAQELTNGNKVIVAEQILGLKPKLMEVRVSRETSMKAALMGAK